MTIVPDDDLLTGVIDDVPATRRRRRPDDTDPNRQALSDPRVKSFLDKIGKSEGADYNTLVGGRKINDLSRHPNRVGLRTSAGPSTAFGKYQIVGTTDRSKLKKYRDLDYSPENQDVRAVELLRQTGSLDALQQGDETTAMRRAGREWASIPNSPLPGRKNTGAWRSQAPQDDLVSGVIAGNDDDLLSGVVDTPAAAVIPPEVGVSVSAPMPRRARPRPRPSSPEVGAGVSANLPRSVVEQQAVTRAMGATRDAAQPHMRRPKQLDMAQMRQQREYARDPTIAEVKQEEEQPKRQLTDAAFETLKKKQANIERTYQGAERGNVANLLTIRGWLSGNHRRH